MRDAIASRDGGKLEDAAHALKGAAGNLKAKAVYQAALRLEESGRAGDLERADERFRLLESELERLERALIELTREREPDATSLEKEEEGALVE